MGQPRRYEFMIALDAEGRRAKPLPLIRVTPRIEPEWLIDLNPRSCAGANRLFCGILQQSGWMYMVATHPGFNVWIESIVISGRASSMRTLILGCRPHHSVSQV